LLVACGGSIDLADYPGSAVDARCQYLARCGLFPDVASCQAYYAHVVLQNPSVQAAVDGGKLGYDGEAAKDCLDALSSASCDRTFSNVSDACDQIFTGKVPDSGACAFDTECVSGNFNVSDCTMACCPGTCVPARPIPGIGQACTFECVDGAYCAPDNTCHAVVPEGASCDNQLACDQGLYCAGVTSTTSGTCTKLPATGQPCTERCANIGDRCAGTCIPVGLPGDSCTTASDCSFYYICDATMHCADRPMDPAMPNGSMCTSSTQCTSHYCGNDGLCADVPLCI
jgi:hypothetical protein